MKEKLVSVIVPTRNSEKTIRACLVSLREQDYPNIEVIVVDNHSTDGTRFIAGEYADKVLQAGPERSAQRNAGARHAAGEFLLFPDSDMVLTGNVLRDCVDIASSDPMVRAIVIPEESFGIGFWSRCRRLERLFYKGVDWLEAARFFRRETFLEMGGYDVNNTGTEDFDLPQRIHALYGPGSIARSSELVYHDEQRRSLPGAIKTNYYYGHGLDVYRSREANKENFRKQYSIVKRYRLFFSDKRTLFKDPVLGAGMLFMKACEFAAWGAGFLVSRMRARRNKADSR